MSETSTQTRSEIMRRFLPASPLPTKLGIRLDALEPERAELSMPFDPENVTLADVVHGGAIAALIDTAGMAVTWSDDAVPESLEGSTISMSVEYVAAARGQDLRAVATTIRRTRALVFSEVAVTEPDGRLVARGSVIQNVGPATRAGG
jgi:uncharacterized protein (TIGR00369 family)